MYNLGALRNKASHKIHRAFHQSSPVAAKVDDYSFQPIVFLEFFKDTANLSRCLIDKACKTEIADAVYYGVISHARFLHFCPHYLECLNRISDIRAFHCDTNLGSRNPFQQSGYKIALFLFHIRCVYTDDMVARTQSSFGGRTPFHRLRYERATVTLHYITAYASIFTGRHFLQFLLIVRAIVFCIRVC